MDLKQRLKRFIHDISKHDRVAIIYHADGDGVASAVVTGKAVEKHRNKPVDLFMSSEHGRVDIIHNHIKVLKRKRINKIIIVDMCVDQNPETVYKIAKFAHVLVLDHHKLYNNISSDRVVFIKSNMINDRIDGSAYPVSKLSYDLFSEYIDIKGIDWISAVGIISDMGFNCWKGFVLKAMKRNKLSVKKDIFKTDLGTVVKLVNYAFVVEPDKSDLAINILYNAKSPNDVIKSKLSELASDIDAEKEYWIKNVKNLAEFYPEKELIFYKVNPKYKIKSLISTILASKYYPHKTIILYLNIKKECHISARRSDYNVAMNELLENAIRNLPNSSGGGHIPAAACVIRKKDFKKFKKKILSQL